MKNSLYVLIATALGLLTGFSQISFLYSTAEVLSELFLNLLKLISLPIVFLSITATITGMKSLREMRMLGGRILRYTILTTLIAASVALMLFLLIHPTDTTGISEQTISSVSFSTYKETLMKIIPSNLFGAFLENNVIGIAFVSIFLSAAILHLKEEQKNTLHQFFSSFFAAILKMTSMIIRLLPIGIWAFMTLFVKEMQQNSHFIERLLLYIICIVSANLIQGLVVLPLFLRLRGISPIKVVKAMSPALLLAFFSKSSNATLPVSMQCAENRLQIQRRVSSFSFPLCSVINMNACAGFILITTLFVAMSNGISFSLLEMVAWIFIASLAAIGNAGVPMGCFFLTSAFLTSMDVPLYMMGIILPIYTVLDMLETSINVWSDSCITTVVDREIKQESEAEAIQV